MKSLITTVFFFVLFTSCLNEEKKPEIVLSESQMVEVMTEFQIAEAIVRLGYHRTTDSLIYNDSIYSALFNKLEITQQQFDTSFSYYSAHPKDFEKIYEQVLTNLSTRAAEIKSINK